MFLNLKQLLNGECYNHVMTKGFKLMPQLKAVGTKTTCSVKK